MGEAGEGLEEWEEDGSPVDREEVWRQVDKAEEEAADSDWRTWQLHLLEHPEKVGPGGAIYINMCILCIYIYNKYICVYIYIYMYIYIYIGS